MNTAVLKLRRWQPAGAAARELILLCLVIAGTLAVELALAERKYGIFGGGFGQSQALTGPVSIAIFALVLTGCHAFVVTLLFAAMRWLHRNFRVEPLFPINFAVLVPALAFGTLAVEYEVLSYFSDAISFQLIRNLGGGSLFDALLFVLSDGALAAGGVIAALIAYVLALRWWMRRRALALRPAQRERGTQNGAHPELVEGLAPRAGLLAFAALTLAAAIYFANLRADVRASLWRFNSYALVDGLLSTATDFDRDGYSLYSYPQDSWPLDSSRYPYALDVPNNGVDEDGLGGDFRIDPAAASAEARAGMALPALPATRKNLVVIVLESTRFDAVSRVFRGHPVTPNISALAAQGSAFPAAYSHVGFTTNSLKSLFSGQLEPQPGTPSLFRDLKANGYRIGIFSGQPESFGDISETVGMKASADVFSDGETLKADRAFGFAAKGSLLVDGKVLLREFDRSFGRREDWSRPVFLYFNLQSAHFPYYHPGMEQLLPGRPIPRDQIALGTRDWVAATYWNAVAQADSQIGALVARLKALGVYDDSIILVTADHGESLFDDGFLGHGHMLNLQQTHIPLVVNVPGVASAAPMGLDDYRGLILRLLGARFQAGRSPAVPNVERPVLEYIGTLDRPTFVAIVEPGQRWTVLKTADRTVRFSDVPGIWDYEGLASHPALAQRAATLVATWERERWVTHLRERSAGAR